MYRQRTTDSTVVIESVEFEVILPMLKIDRKWSLYLPRFVYQPTRVVAFKIAPAPKGSLLNLSIVNGLSRTNCKVQLVILTYHRW